MQIIKTIEEMKLYSKECKKKGITIGFVPTMGFLHEGHLSLIKSAKKDSDFVVVSIYVNPTQFGPNEDLSNYPRDFEKDKTLCGKEGVDVIFYPNDKMMYPNGYKTYVTVEEITKALCGKSRPVHFRGVATIVTKLFNIVKPDYAYFGLKDYQQCLVIKKLVEDLNLDIKLVFCPIVREKEGLAKSSRNKYLSEQERKEAVVLSESLQMAKKEFDNGNDSVLNIKNKIINNINTKKSAKIDYVEILDKDSLAQIEKIIKNKTVIALAVFFGKARLIDNIVL